MRTLQPLILVQSLTVRGYSLFSSGRAKPVNYTNVYSLKELTNGLAALERRETWGKAIVRVRDEKPAKL